MMLDWLGRLLRVHRSEWSKVLLFTLLGALVQAGIAIGTSVSDSAFLSRLGSDKLPYVYMLMPLVMMIFIPAYNNWISKYGIDKIFSISMAAVSIGSTLFFFVFLIPMDAFPTLVNTVLLFFVKIWPFALLLALSTLFWNMIEGYFDIIDAKRLFSFFNGGLAAGAAAGGAFVSAFSESLGIGPLFLLWAFFGIMCLPVVSAIRKRWKRLEESEDSDSSGGIKGQVTLVVGAMKSSKYVLMVNFSILTLFLVTTLNEYQYMDILSQNRSEQELAALFGVLFTIASVFNLVVNFFFFNRMVGFLGVRNLALVQPLVYSISFFWLAVDRSFDAAVFAFFAYQGFMAAIELNNVNFIFNAISSDVRRQVRSFAEGIGDPIAMALAGFLLLVVLGNVSDSTVPFIGLGVSALYTFFALGVRARYRSSLLSSLRRDWLDFSKLPSASLAQVSDDAMSKEIGEVDLPNQVLLLETLAMHNPQLAIVQLLTCIDSSSRQEQKYLSSVLAGLLKTGNADVLREVILWFHKKTRDIDDSIYETLAASGLLLPSSCQGRVIPQLVSGLVSRSPEDNVFALKAIQDMSLGSVQSLEAALRAVGLGGNFRHAWWAASFCAHKSEAIRIAAAEAVSLLARKGDGSLAPFLFPMLNGSEMERMKALTGLAKIGDVGMIAGLLEASRSLSPRERRMVAGIVSTIGIHSVPALVSIIRDQTAFSSVRAIAARALAKVSWPQFEQLAPSLINNEMIAAYRAVAWRVVIEKLELDGAAQRIFALCRRTEANDRIFFVLELLALSGRVGDIDLVSSSLQSTNSRQRGNAIESLEQDIPRPVFKKLLPLIDSRNDNERLAAGVRLFKIKIPNGDEAIAEAMESQETLSQAAALHVSAGEGKNRLIELGVHILQTERDADVRLTARILLARTAGGSESSLLTPVEKADLLARSDVFGGLGVGDIMALADLALDGTSCRESFDAYCCIYNFEDPVLTGRDLLWGGNSQSRTDLTSSPPLLALHPESVLQLARIRTAIAVRLLSVAGGAA